MRKENEIIFLSGKEAVTVLREIEYMLISLRDIGDYYYFRPGLDNCSDEEKELAFCKEITNFICKNNIINRLANIREILSDRFNDDIIEGEDMGDLEKEMQNINYWKKPGD